MPAAIRCCPRGAEGAKGEQPGGRKGGQQGFVGGKCPALSCSVNGKRKSFTFRRAWEQSSLGKPLLVMNAYQQDKEVAACESSKSVRKGGSKRASLELDAVGPPHSQEMLQVAGETLEALLCGSRQVDTDSF